MSIEVKALKLVEGLREMLAELDRIGAEVAAAHVDSAVHALCRQFDLQLETSVTE